MQDNFKEYCMYVVIVLMYGNEINTAETKCHSTSKNKGRHACGKALPGKNRHQWNSKHVFALLCGVADRPSICIVASLRILHSNTEHCHIVVSLKFYKVLNRYYGYSVHQNSSLQFCGESSDLSFARSVTQKIWTSKLRADSLSTTHVKWKAYENKNDRPSRWVAIWCILGSLIKLWVLHPISNKVCPPSLHLADDSLPSLSVCLLSILFLISLFSLFQ
jgi:hypothetical protein